MTAVPGPALPPSDGGLCVGQFPDLTKDDQQQLGAIKKAYLKKLENPARYGQRYDTAKKQLIDRTRGLQAAMELPGQTRVDKLKLVARLINFHEVMVMLNISPAEYLPAEPRPLAEPQVYSEGDFSAGLSPELKGMLDLPNGEGTFLSALNKQARNIFLAFDLENEIRIMKTSETDRSIGANEPVTRTIIVDSSIEIYKQAATLVHEAAHLEYTFKFAGEPRRQNRLLSERFAFIRELSWMEAYLEKSDLPNDKREKVTAYRAALYKQIGELNLKLNLKADDLSFN